LGISVKEYDEMTPRQLALYAEAYKDRREDVQMEIYLSAYLTAGFAGILFSRKNAKLPAYDQVFKKQKREMTDDEMLKVVIALNAAAGGIDMRGEK